MGCIGGDNEFRCGITKRDGDSDEKEPHNDSKAETLFVGFNVFSVVVFAECAADHGGGGDSDGHAEANKEEKGCGRRADGGEGVGF